MPSALEFEGEALPDRSPLPRSDEATALALDLLDAAARSEGKGRLGDSKIVDTQQTEEATEGLRQVRTPLPCLALSA